MNNNEDYLWDRTGEPDPETQKLEEILGTLRYQSRPLEIPIEVKIERQRNFFRGSLAIAASLALLLLGLGLWLASQRLERTKPVAVSPPDLRSTPAPATVPSFDENLTAAPGPEQKGSETPKQRPVNKPLLAKYTNRSRNQSRNAALQNRLLAAQQQKEAEAARDQLMLALRVVSAKLNYAQKKTQSPNPRDLIHNQHKIG